MEVNAMKPVGFERSGKTPQSFPIRRICVSFHLSSNSMGSNGMAIKGLSLCEINREKLIGQISHLIYVCTAP